MSHITLFRKDGSVAGEALVDAEDVGWLSEHTWRLTANGYAARWSHVDGRSRIVLMHREVLGLAAGGGHAGGGHSRVGRHRNRMTLDNRRSNLEVLSARENRRASRPYGRSGVKNVYWSEAVGLWNARLDLGHFPSVEEAAAALEAVRRLLPERTA